MEKRSRQAPGVVEGRVLSTSWRASAVVNDDSKKFAAELEQILNDCSADGYTLAQMIPRQGDNGLVLVHQKHTFAKDSLESGTPLPGVN